MFNLHYSKSGTAALMTLLISTAAVAPAFITNSASAQIFSQGRNSTNHSNQVAIPAGTVIPLEHEKAERILVGKDETLPITLTVAAHIKNRYGTILIPFGTEVTGRIEPYGEGARFVAEELVFSNSNRQYVDRQYVDGVSRTIVTTETVSRSAKTGTILKGTAIGAAAAAVLAGVTGDKAIATEEVLAGAGAGALGGVILGRRKVEVISINPQTDLDMTLRSQLPIR